jgi:hypothetical protein
MRRTKIVVVQLVFAVTAGCAGTGFVSSSKSPTAQPLDLSDAKVAAVVIMEDQTQRRSAENVLAQEISAQGAVGVPMYSIHADSTPKDEPAVRAALERAQVKGLVVMRPVSIELDATVTPVKSSESTQREYWGSYYSSAWGTPYGTEQVTGGDLIPKRTVIVETLVYSMPQNQLVWSGQSKHVNPAELESSIRELAQATARELRKQGLIAGQGK